MTMEQRTFLEDMRADLALKLDACRKEMELVEKLLAIKDSDQIEIRQPGRCKRVPIVTATLPPVQVAPDCVPQAIQQEAAQSAFEHERDTHQTTALAGTVDEPSTVTKAAKIYLALPDAPHRTMADILGAAKAMAPRAYARAEKEQVSGASKLIASSLRWWVLKEKLRKHGDGPMATYEVVDAGFFDKEVDE